MSTGAISEKNAGYFQAVVADGAALNHYVPFTSSAADSLVLDPNTTLVELFSTQDCWVRVKPSTSAAVATTGSSTAKTESRFVPGGIVCFLGIPKVDGVLHKISVVRDTNSGTLYIAEAP